MNFILLHDNFITATLIYQKHLSTWVIKMTTQDTKLNMDNKPTTLLSSLFWALTAIFISLLVIVVALNLDLPLRDYGKYIFPAILSVFLLLSIALLVVAIRERFRKILRIFLILTAASALGTAAGILLENFLTGTYGEGIFFVIGVIIAPLGFLAGIIGSIVLFIKRGT